MIASARNAYILKRLEETGIIDYKSIAKELDVSEATVRRDFEKLEKNGQLRRVQGGAVKNDEMIVGELSMLAKNNVNAQEKQSVASAAAQEVQDGERIYLDCGTSIAPLAQILLKKKVHIVTNNSLILPYITQQAAADVFLLGGRFSPADQMVTGPLTENTLSTFTFNRCFIGCMGLDLAKKAVYVTDMECLALKKMAMRNSEKTYLLLDASKENKKGPFRLAEYTEFDVVYVNKSEHRKKYPDNFIVV